MAPERRHRSTVPNHRATTENAAMVTGSATNGYSSSIDHHQYVGTNQLAHHGQTPSIRLQMDGHPTYTYLDRPWAQDSSVQEHLATPNGIVPMQSWHTSYLVHRPSTFVPQLLNQGVALNTNNRVTAQPNATPVTQSDMTPMQRWQAGSMYDDAWHGIEMYVPGIGSTDVGQQHNVMGTGDGYEEVAEGAQGDGEGDSMICEAASSERGNPFYTA